MAKTSVEIDDHKLEAAREILRTGTKRATIDAALDEVIDLERRRRLVERLRHLNGTDLADPEVMDAAWR